MVDGALWALAVEGGRGDWNVVFAMVAAAFWAAAFGTVWLGRGETDGDSELETNERLESAYRALSELVAAFVAERKRRNASNDAADDGNGENAATREDASTNVGVKLEKDGELGEDAQGDFADADAGTLNAVDFWREDYWNFDFGLDRDPTAEAEDDPDAWKKDGKNDARETNAPTGTNDSNVDERPRTGNYFGAFFQRRNNSQGNENGGEGREERPARWKRPKNNDGASGESGTTGEVAEKTKDAAFEKKDDANDRRNRTSERDVDGKDDAERNAASTGRVFFETDEREPWDDSNADAEETFDLDSDYNDGALWEDEPDYAFLDDETKSDDEKIAYLKRRIDDGDFGAREELARLLLQTAAEAGRADAEKAFAALDEAERLVAEMEDDGGDAEECRELLGQILLQRPYFYLRNEMTPPIGSANAALAQIRSWANDASGPDARRLLATAWQIQGNCQAALGSSVAALSSFRTARDRKSVV